MAIGRAGGAGNSGSAEAARRAAAEAARRAAEEAARRAAAESARRAAEAAARQASEAAARQPAELAPRQPVELAKRQQQSSFEPAGAKNRLNLDGAAAPATSLLNENTNDTAVNCLDQAADWVNRSSPELQARSELVFLEDQRAGAEAQSGHVVVRQGERVLDPSTGTSYEDMQAYSRENPEYREVGTLPGTTAARVFATEPGSPERAQALADANVSPELQRMMVADPPVEGDVPNPATAEPRDISIPGQAGPVSVEFSDTLERDLQREDGNVTVNIEAETSVSATGTVEIGTARVGASVSAGASSGERLSYEVTMSEADFARLQRGEIPPPHPLNPESLPDGASITMEQSQFTGTSLEAGLSSLAGELGLSSDVTQGEGMSLEVSRTGDSVQVTAGPTRFIESGGGVSVGRGPVSVDVGRTNSLTEYQLRTARFDLAHPQGQAAFNAFATSGELPTQEGPGVSNTLRLERLTSESVGSRYGINVEDVTFGTEGVTNTGEYLITHNADGTRTLSAEASYGGDHPDLTFEERYDAQGQPIPGTAQYTLEFDTEDALRREALVRSFGGDAAEVQAARDGDAPISVSLTPDEVRELQRRSSEQPQSHLGLGGVLTDLDGEPAAPFVAVRNMAASPVYGENVLADSYWNLYLDSGNTTLPGSVSVG
ncbi:hypothetical protein [Pyxidicoccus xibeiensis]|uniref:hypothetical protein n=1 Tax=Pyxidicoccus xibeiensis TaxID=2906759 RepID=UPI0020A80391|nr:hypothetical protein [Pyxidicoccus xibeiensis]MCP3143143.1 hypothetical protein [Pyxidicoccus xibeiensis]